MIVALVVFASAAMAAEVAVYPGATLDQRATHDANEAAKEAKLSSSAKVYTTNDPFEKVAAFYKGMGREFVMPVPDKGAKSMFVILDDAKSLGSSKRWAKIQRPAIGLYKEDVAEMKSHDVTVILVVEK